MLGNNRGMAMLIALTLITILLILSGTMFLLSSSHFGTSYQQVSRSRASYAAEAAMQHVLWACRTGHVDYNLEAIPSGGSITPTDSTAITIDDPSYNLNADVKIYAEGEQGAPAGTHRIDITVDY